MSDLTVGRVTFGPQGKRWIGDAGELHDGSYVTSKSMAKRLAIQRGVVAVEERRCDGCRWWEPEACQNEYISEYGSSAEDDFYAPPDFYCKFWEAK